MSKPKKTLPKSALSATGTPQSNANDQPLPEGPPSDVAAIRREIRAFLRRPIGQRKTIGGARCGVYAFYDYDGEPIYVGKTYEGVGARIGRHLTNQRTDAVAMNVLDPFEVAEVSVWLLEEFAWLTKAEVKAHKSVIEPALNRAEYTLYLKVIEESSFKAVLNEQPPRKTEIIELPPAFSGRIIPADIYPQRKHPDVRIARRASTIAALARVISEREVTKWLRGTLLTQARRLERLAAERLADFARTADSEEDVESRD